MNDNNIYSDGEYLKANPTWHSEDSPWKAKQVIDIVERNKLNPRVVAEIGCGAGVVLDELSRRLPLESIAFKGYDISPHAIEIARTIQNDKLEFHCKDLLSQENVEFFDLLLAMDVMEHVPDYMHFLARCRDKAQYKIFHVPLDIHVSSVLRNSFINGRYSVGHLHYFTADSAIAAIRDAGHEIVDYVYTNAAIDLFRQNPSLKRAIANMPRWVFSRFSVSFAARVLGGYSLLVLTK